MKLRVRNKKVVRECKVKALSLRAEGEAIPKQSPEMSLRAPLETKALRRRARSLVLLGINSAISGVKLSFDTPNEHPAFNNVRECSQTCPRESGNRLGNFLTYFMKMGKIELVPAKAGIG